jgi:hypothetical protein
MYLSCQLCSIRLLLKKRLPASRALRYEGFSHGRCVTCRACHHPDSKRTPDPGKRTALEPMRAMTYYPRRADPVLKRLTRLGTQITVLVLLNELQIASARPSLDYSTKPIFLKIIAYDLSRFFLRLRVERSGQDGRGHAHRKKPVNCWDLVNQGYLQGQ